jgi:hypothetical protein
MTTTSMRVAHRAQMVTKSSDIDAIIVTGIVFSPPGATIASS